MLVNYTWPGNVRQLQNVIERAVVLGSADVIEPGDLPEELHNTRPSRAMTYYDVLRDTKRRLLESALARTAGDYKEAATLLGLHPKGMHRVIRQLELTHLLK
jgi:Nif-specific regulatory protein